MGSKSQIARGVLVEGREREDDTECSRERARRDQPKAGSWDWTEEREGGMAKGRGIEDEIWRGRFEKLGGGCCVKLCL